ncbi:MAG: MBL fold metallo-hydrolase [Chitinophagaceae bacterium]|nr:MAG: MBL fold metallo-hydrolase [Chitinophagaceae bacterium]
MSIIHHLNCVKIVSPLAPDVCGHCLLLKEENKLILIDTGIGLLDTLHPLERIGQAMIDRIGYRFDESWTAFRQIEGLKYDPASVTDCIISHLDNDHIGGLADFPQATVHVGYEELQNFQSGNPRYLTIPLDHKPEIKTYATTDRDWFGIEARKVAAETETEILLIPLFGHTSGHCGVAIHLNGKWILFTGDAYYLRAELDNPEHPVTQLAIMSADDNEMRIASLDKIRKLAMKYKEIEFFGYHDISEFN